MKLKPDEATSALALLKKLPLFEGVDEAALGALVQGLDARRLGPGKVVIMDQEIGRTLFVLASGKVSVWKKINQEKKKLAELEAPNFVGERIMFEESPASAMVKTEIDCLLYALERPAFDQAATAHPAMVETIRAHLPGLRAQRITPERPKSE